MRWLAIALGLISLLLLALSLGSGALAVMPARGGEDLIHFAGVCLWTALALGATATVLSVLDVRKQRRATSVLALILSLGAIAGAAGLELFVLAFSAMGQSEQEAQQKAHLELVRPVSPADEERAEAVTIDALVEAWTTDPHALEARYRGHTLALTGSLMTGFLSGDRCAFPPDHGDIGLCLTDAQPDVNAVTTLVCRFGGIRNPYGDQREAGNQLVLEGCASARGSPAP